MAYRTGYKNTKADALSRQYPEQGHASENQYPYYLLDASTLSHGNSIIVYTQGNLTTYPVNVPKDVLMSLPDSENR